MLRWEAEIHQEAATGGSSSSTDESKGGSRPVTRPQAAKKADDEETAKTETAKTDYKIHVHETFDTMELPEKLLRGVYGYGFERPSAIQAKAVVPMATSKRDIIAQAQSGTGKTGAFVMGSLAQVEQSLKDVQVIVLSPTRELAMQSAKIFDAFSLHMGIECRVFVGGGRVSDDIRALERGCQVVCGTPGRILDLIESRRALYTDKVKCFILDEADEMLDFGFADQIYKIFGFVPQSSQCVLVSATLPPEALDISTKFMRDPIEILVKKEALTLAGIKQFYVDCEKEEWKYGVLADLYECLSISQSIIFVNSRAKADWLGELMNKDGHTVAVMHAELEQDKRKLVIEQFRTGSCRVLISTDVLARGFDVQQVSVVINFDQPRDVSNYLHRIGRAGRYGRKGTGINLLSGSRDVDSMRGVEQHYNTTVDEMPANIADLID